MLSSPLPEKHSMSSYWVFHATLLALGSWCVWEYDDNDKTQIKFVCFNNINPMMQQP